MVLITIVTGAYKQTYNWGASHCIYLYTYGDDWGMVNLLHCFTHTNPFFLLQKLTPKKIGLVWHFSLFFGLGTIGFLIVVIEN